MFHISYKISTVYSGVQSCKITASTLRKMFFFTIFFLKLIEVGNRNFSNNFFCNCFLAAPGPTLDHYRGGSLNHPMLITAFLHIRPEGHQELRNELTSTEIILRETFRNKGYSLLKNGNPLFLCFAA